MIRHIQKRPFVSNIKPTKSLANMDAKIKADVAAYLAKGKTIQVLKSAGDECSKFLAMTGVDDL